MERPSAEQLSTHAVWLALARASFGVPALAAPDLVARGLGLPRSRRGGSHRFFAGFFGVREVLLGGFLLASRRDLRRLGPVVAFATLADMGDTAFVARELSRRREVEPGAAFLLLSGLAGSLMSAALLWEVRQADAGQA